MRRRNVAIASLLSVAMSWPNRVINPRVGRSARNKRRMSEVLPAPRAGLAFGFPLGFRSVNERPASLQESPGLARFADADHLHELWNLLSGRCGLTRADRAVGSLRPLQADMVCGQRRGLGGCCR